MNGLLMTKLRTWGLTRKPRQRFGNALVRSVGAFHDLLRLIERRVAEALLFKRDATTGARQDRRTGVNS